LRCGGKSNITPLTAASVDQTSLDQVIVPLDVYLNLSKTSSF
jgi:hypothetical protein